MVTRCYPNIFSEIPLNDFLVGTTERLVRDRCVVPTKKINEAACDENAANTNDATPWISGPSCLRVNALG